MNNIVLFIGIFVAVAGLFFAIMPHDLHNEIIGGVAGIHEGSEGNGSHETHQIYGAIAAVVGMVIAFVGTKLK